MPEILARGTLLSYAVEPEELNPLDLAIVFVHGSGGDSQDWKYQLTGLSRTVPIIALELPGHGGSPPPALERVEAHAQCVMDFVDALGLRKVMLVGCSLGSAITLSVALSKPSWLTAIGLVGAGARLRVLPALLEGLKVAPDTALAMLADFCLSPASAPEVHEEIRQKLLAATADVVHKDLSACDRFDVMNRLGEISLPAWIIVGEDDRLTPVKYAQYLNRGLSSSSLTVVPRAGHLVMMEQPESFNESLLRFLSTSGLLS